jgi:hypothetical protein
MAVEGECKTADYYVFDLVRVQRFNNSLRSSASIVVRA